MKDTSLHTPRTKPVGINSLLHCYGYVLMPGHFPVGVRNLVEQDSANREEFVAKNCLHERAHCGRLGKRDNCRNLQKIANCKDAPVSKQRPVFRHICQRCNQINDLLVC